MSPIQGFNHSPSLGSKQEKKKKKGLNSIEIRGLLSYVSFVTFPFKKINKKYLIIYRIIIIFYLITKEICKLNAVKWPSPSPSTLLQPSACFGYYWEGVSGSKPNGSTSYFLRSVYNSLTLKTTSIFNDQFLNSILSKYQLLP